MAKANTTPSSAKGDIIYVLLAAYQGTTLVRVPVVHVIMA